MKMIKLLVLLDGTMVKVSKDMEVGTLMNTHKGVDQICGAIYSVSYDIYKKRHNKVLKKLFIDSIYNPQIKF